MHVAWNRY